MNWQIVDAALQAEVDGGRFPGFSDAVGDHIPALRALKVLPAPDAPLGSALPDQALPGRGHSFAASVFRETPAVDPAAQAGDVQWSGMSATRWMVAPKDRFGLVLMTQRYLGSGLPCWPRFKQAVSAAMDR